MQPPPVETDTPEVWPLILADLDHGALVRPERSDVSGPLRAACAARDAFGRERYGVGLQVENGRDPLADALDEALDGMAYTRQHYERVKRITPENRARIQRAWNLHRAAVSLAVMVLAEREGR